ncbi:MAG: calcineurin-like phosphoesterase family protein [Bacteroidales bacterium]|nr:calcineurin-like phosphoesterase family protein [Bacteroidales bacterium]
MRTRLVILALALSTVLLPCCSEDPVPVDPSRQQAQLVERVSLPEVISGAAGSLYSIPGRGFAKGDIFVFEAESGAVELPVLTVGTGSCTVEISHDFVSGTRYDVSLVRGDKYQSLGVTQVIIIVPEMEYNLSGRVCCEGTGIPDVWVCDGKSWAKTDSDGRYSMLSGKERGYVYVVSPSGYAPVQDGAWPEFWKTLSSNDVSHIETVDFSLRKVSDKAHKVIMSADWQLRGERTPADYLQTADFFAEAGAYASSVSEPVYAFTLGDETWDICWGDHNFGLPEFREFAKPFPVPLYTIIGNHDHNPAATNDFTAAAIYRKVLGPTNYSLNIGDVHYIVMDDVAYTPSTRATVEQFTEDQLEWLRADLSHVSKVTPIVFCAHVPLHKWTWSGTEWKAAERGVNYSKALEMLKEYEMVHIFTGHSHFNEFFDVRECKLSTRDMYEHKVTALGGCMWYTMMLVGYNVSRDGIPSGYEVLDIDGRSIKWRFKGVGKPDDYQARIHDMSKVEAFWNSDAKMRNLAASNPEYSFDNLFAGIPDGAVLFNVFRGDPHMAGLKLEVSDSKGPLELHEAYVKDPLVHYASEASWWSLHKQLPS